MFISASFIYIFTFYINIYSWYSKNLKVQYCNSTFPKIPPMVATAGQQVLHSRINLSAASETELQFSISDSVLTGGRILCVSRQELWLFSSKHFIYCDKPHLWVTPPRNTGILINKKTLRLQLTSSQIKLSGQMCLLLNSCLWYDRSLYEIITLGCQPLTASDTASEETGRSNNMRRSSYLSPRRRTL